MSAETKRQKRCFIISPIGQPDSPIRNHADDVYRFIIRPALEKFDVFPERSDEISESGWITEQMFERIFCADLCVVLLTGHNPNVFYELAVAQCAARPTILLIERGQTLPFDIKDLRTIEYQLQPIGPLVDGHYAAVMEQQVAELQARHWQASGLFEQFRFAPKLHTEQQYRRLIHDTRPAVLPVSLECQYALPFDAERRLTIVTGDLIEMASNDKLKQFGIDAIVSLENIYLQLDSYYATTLSGKLRYLDAEKSRSGLLTDALRSELDQEIASRQLVLPVAPGTVIATRTHRLAQQGVKAVFHVAGTRGTPGDGYELFDEAVDDCVRGVFDTFAERHADLGINTLMLPMLGSFTTRLDQNDVVRRILRTVLLKLEYMRECRHIFLHAWIESQRSALCQVANELGLPRIEPADDETGDVASDTATHSTSQPTV